MKKFTKTPTFTVFYLFLSPVLHVTLGQIYDTKTVDAGGSLQLVCEANVPVHWCYPGMYATPDLPQNFIYESPVSVSYSKDDKYRTTLDISNVSYVYTGFYHCAKNNTQELCNRRMGSIKSTYIYVEDNEHLLVVKHFKQVPAYKFEKAVLPCLKTHPNITVTLSRGGLEIVEGTQENSSLNVTYDPTLGYVLEPTPSEDSSYVCTATWGEQTEKFTIDIVPTERKREILSPVIYQGENRVQKLILQEGDSLNLTCFIHQKEEVAFDIAWTYPSQADVEIERNNCYFQGYICKNSTLTVRNITAPGGGTYECMTVSPGYESEKAIVEIGVISQRVVRKANYASRLQEASSGSNVISSVLSAICVMILHFVTRICRQMY